MPTLPSGLALVAAPPAPLAVEEGVVSPEEDLLVPRFYIRPGLQDPTRDVQGLM